MYFNAFHRNLHVCSDSVALVFILLGRIKIDLFLVAPSAGNGATLFLSESVTSASSVSLPFCVPNASFANGLRVLPVHPVVLLSLWACSISAIPSSSIARVRQLASAVSPRTKNTMSYSLAWAFVVEQPIGISPARILEGRVSLH